MNRPAITVILLSLAILSAGCKGREMGTDISIHLMFEGKAGEALELYKQAFPELEVTGIERFSEEENMPEEAIKAGRFRIGTQTFVIIDSPVSHGFTFTPAMSVFVELESAARFDSVYEMLSKEAQVYMPPDDYGFSEKFFWVQDRFGVSWQISLVD